MDILAEYTLDEDLSNNGKWFTLKGKAKVRVAWAQNDAYRQYLRDEFQRVGYDNTDDSDDNQKLGERIVVQATARHILLGWQGLTEKNIVVGYSVEKAQEYLGKTEFFKKIHELAGNFASFRAAQDEQQKKD